MVRVPGQGAVFVPAFDTPFSAPRAEGGVCHLVEPWPQASWPSAHTSFLAGMAHTSGVLATTGALLKDSRLWSSYFATFSSWFS